MKIFQWFGKQQTHDGKRGAAFEFDFSKVPDVDDHTVRAFFNTTHTKSRQMPLLIARHVFEQLEQRVTSPGQLGALELAEIRGGMRALRAFGVYYTQGVEEWTKRSGGRRDQDGEN